MGFNLLLSLIGNGSGRPDKSWIQKLYELIPDMKINVSSSIEEAMEHIEEADAAYGEVPPKLFEKAKNLRWIACPMAGPPKGYYHQALIESDVIVTNVRGIFNDHISAHIMAFVLAFADDPEIRDVRRIGSRIRIRQCETRNLLTNSETRQVVIFL